MRGRPMVLSYQNNEMLELSANGLHKFVDDDDSELRQDAFGGRPVSTEPHPFEKLFNTELRKGVEDFSWDEQFTAPLPKSMNNTNPRASRRGMVKCVRVEDEHGTRIERYDHNGEYLGERYLGTTTD